MKHLLSSTAYLILNKRLASQIGIQPTVLLADLISKEEYFINNNLIEDGWFFNTEANIEKDTTLTPYQQRKIIKTLKDLELIEAKRKGVPAKMFFKINEEQVVKFLKDKTFNNSTTINKNKKIRINKKTNIKERFIFEVLTHEYPKAMLEDFIDYWTEGKIKMRFQKHKTFEIKARLARWEKNEKKWEKKRIPMSKLDSQLDSWEKAKKEL
ncbi:MAG: hypothetical protein Unbinned579contig1003_9 [Prokaryotic dsDNA virus sp.]|nr:MAG: hypothetical protein Unbinned579contig1003_9 [Prokaryotic dsDNA virus sp.]|tara:strand:+ start:14790 stop:15422 length:633 start_codon:yes stop_codon:yes gene_type:complete